MEGSNGEMERRGEHLGHGLLIKLLAKGFMEAQDNLVYFKDINFSPQTFDNVLLLKRTPTQIIEHGGFELVPT